MPLGQMPVMRYTDENGKERVVCQCNTIARTVARWCGLDGKTDAEKTTVDEAFEA